MGFSGVMQMLGGKSENQQAQQGTNSDDNGFQQFQNQQQGGFNSQQGPSNQQGQQFNQGSNSNKVAFAPQQSRRVQSVIRR